ncbi:MAG: peptidyl-prolyl cis-trans isomerase [Elusimicrobiales bacterium]|nr:peptidyl-prolyl cis-trans isomerase [Elusimicrobiales bacterium]
MIKLCMFIMMFGGLLNSQTNVISTVNGEKITMDEIKNRMTLNYFTKTLDEAIGDKLIIQEAKKRNISVSKDELNKAINQIKQRFTKEDDFKKELKRIGISEKDYYSMIETNLLIEKAIITILNINPTDEDAKKYYDSNPSQFDIPEALKIRQIYVNTEQEAKDILIALDAGASFERLAEIKSADERLRQSKGDIGFISKGMLLPDIENEIFLTPIGKYTKPVKTGNGYSIFKVEEKREQNKLKFEDVKEKIKELIKSSQIQNGRQQLINQLREKATIK